MPPRGPKMPQNGPKSLPRTPPRPPKTPSRPPQEWPRTRPRPPLDPPRFAKTTPGPPKTSQESPRPPNTAQNTPLRPPKIPPRPPQEPPEVLINWRGGTKAQPSSIRRPSRVGVLNTAHGFSESFLPSSFRILLLGGSCLPLLNPPPVASGRLHLLRRSAALARLGGSWAEKVAFQEAFKN